MSSDYEGMSNAMIEAICVGLPVATTRVSGTKELIEDGKNGFVVEIGDEKGLSDSLVKLMSDSDLQSEMLMNNRQRANFFKIESVTNQWLQLINKVKDESQD